MKYITRLILIIFSVLFLLSVNSKAADMSAGMSAWYAHWELKQKYSGSGEVNNDLEYALFYGPALSLSLSEDFSLSLQFLYAYYETETSFGQGEPRPYQARRYDSDLLLNYSVVKYLKIFAGAKYLGFQWDQKDNSKGVFHSYGPGAGIGLSLPLFSNFYLLGNISGIYIKGKFNPDASPGTGMNDSDISGYGLNSNLSLAYYIAEAAITLSAGYRYQYFYNDFEDIEGFEQKQYFQGATFLIVKSFDL